MRAGCSTARSLIATDATSAAVPICLQAVKLRTRGDLAQENWLLSSRSELLPMGMATRGEH